MHEQDVMVFTEAEEERLGQVCEALGASRQNALRCLASGMVTDTRGVISQARAGAMLLGLAMPLLWDGDQA